MTNTTEFERKDPPLQAGEKDTLLGFLRFLRETIVFKCVGLSEEQLRATPLPSTMSLLGIVKHITYVERYWFQRTFLDAPVHFPWTDDDPDADWRLESEDTGSSIIEGYVAEYTTSDQIVADHDLSDLAIVTRPEEQQCSLRWIVTHMIEETARHCGHADLLREALDGTTGE